MKKELQLVALGLLLLLGMPLHAQLFSETFTSTTISTTNWPSTCRSGFDITASTTTIPVVCSGSTTDYVGRLNGSTEYLTTKALVAPENGVFKIDFSYSYGSTTSLPKLQYGTGASCPFSYTDIATLSGTGTGCNTASHTFNVTAGTTYWIRWDANSTTALLLDDITITFQPPCNAATGTGCSSLAGTSNRLVTRACGEMTSCDTWNLCTTTCADACLVWATAQFNTRNMVVRHSVTVDAGFSTTYQQNIGSIYIDPGTSLTLNTAWPGRTSGSHMIEVCGTLNIKSGNSDFGNHTLEVNSGGVVNVDGGELEIDKIIVRNGGTINFNGGALRRACGSSAAVGLTVEDGGLININNSTSQLLVTSSCFGEPYTVLDGTIDCKNTLSTSTIASRFRLSYCRVTNSTSTGRMRTQTQYTPSIDWQTTTLPYSSRSANGTFTGYSSTYGGLVEYYGSSNITIDNSALTSLYQYYNLEVNMTGGAELRLGKANIFDVVGVLYLTSGNLNLNDRHLRLRGDIIYGTGALKGTSSSTLTMVGKLSGASADFVNSGMTTFEVWAKSKAASENVNCLNPELRFVAGSRTLGTLEINREDVVHLTTDLSIATKLRLEDGVLNTRNVILHVTATDSGAVEHNTTGTALSSWISGNLRRSVVPGVNYDFPVGYPQIGTVGGSTNNYHPNNLNYRRYMLELGTATGMNYVDVNFENPTATCEGSMPVISEGGLEFLQIHPEGHWNVEPDGGTGITYNARMYVQGFQTGPELVDNEFGGLKRPNGGVCADWSIAGGTRPAEGQPGRVVQAIDASKAIGYAKRIGWISFSDQAIGVAGGDPVLSTDGTFRL